MASFVEFVETISPPWLAGTWGGRFLFGIALTVDALREQLRQAVLARMPLEAPPDALPYIGADRRIERGIGESDASYADRLAGAFDAWSTAGNPPALLGQIRGYLSPSSNPITGYHARTVSNSSVWFTIDADGAVTQTPASPANWDWDGDGGAWWRYWLILYSDIGPWEDDGTWDDDGEWDDGGTWDTTATPQEVAAVKRIAGQWSAAHNSNPVVDGTLGPFWIVVSFDGAAFDPAAAPGAPMPDGTWGNWHTTAGGVVVQSRSQSASYWPGVPVAWTYHGVTYVD